MNDIKIETGLQGYLDKDLEVATQSMKDWWPELDALCRLADIYRRLLDLLVISDKNLNLPAQLLLVSLNQLYGIASALLRRRSRDAIALTRRAIEAAGIAHRVWEQPGLIQVFNDAYPDILKSRHRKQFEPSRKYRNEFSASKMFNRSGKTWQTLNVLYDLFSASASHAGLGALTGQKWKDGYLSLQQRETDKAELGRSWHAVINAYWEILKVFFAILKSSIKNGMSAAVEADMMKWREGYEKMLPERTGWIPDIQPHS